MKLKNLLLIALITLNVSVFSQEKLNVQTIVLDNGLTVYLNEDHNATKVFGAVAVNAGSKNDPATSTGIAHYLEHMLFKGTQKIGTWNWEKEQIYMNKIIYLYDELGKATEQLVIDSIQNEINKNTVKASKYNMPNEFDKLINNIGGTGLNAFTSEDMTFYHNSFPSSQINKWLSLYSERLINPVFRSFQSELEVVYEEKNRSMDNFIYKILEELNQNMFKGHPYGTQTTLGSVEHLKKPSLTNMYNFYKQYYVASNMALILVGDFNSDKIIPIIKKQFGRLPKGERAKTNFDKPLGFEGKVVEKRRYTPVKLGILGYKTVPSNNDDNYTLDVINYILNNENQTGLLDKLALDNDLMVSESMSMSYKDDGGLVIYFLPKIVGQSLGKAEALVLNVLNELKTGDFNKVLLENAKQKIIQDYKFEMEDIESRGIGFGDMFVMGKTVKQINSYTKYISKVSIEDVKGIASKYFGENYFAMYSKMGFPKKTKLSKPGFKPVKPVQYKSSDFAYKFRGQKGLKVKPKYLDFKKDLYVGSLEGNSVLYANKNPYNDLFSLEISYNIGEEKYAELPFLTQLLDFAGTEKYPVEDLKLRFADLGITYSFSSNDNYFNVYLEGNENGLKEALVIINSIMRKPVIDENKLKQVVDNINSGRKMAYKDPSGMGAVLANYAIYGDESPYLTQASIKELKKYNLTNLLSVLTDITTYSANVYYTGVSSPESISELLLKSYRLDKSDKKEEYFIRKEIKNTENKVFFVNDKNTVQSQVYFYVNGGDYTQDLYPKINAFNTYFGRGFSGLVMQEIREYRSMAYTAYGYYTNPKMQGTPSKLIGFVGCQADKTIDAIHIMDSLITDMPQKPERIDMIRNKLYLESQTSYPSFRNVPNKVAEYNRFKIMEDPNIKASEVYRKLKFDDIYKFWKNNISSKPVVITIYGNKKRVDTGKLSEYGKLIEKSKKDIYIY